MQPPFLGGAQLQALLLLAWSSSQDAESKPTRNPGSQSFQGNLLHLYAAQGFSVPAVPVIYAGGRR